MSALPPDENWADVRQQVPGKRATNPPVVFASTEPAELLLTDGGPSFSPIGGTKLMRVANTDMPLFLFSGDKKYYLLIAGRWFKADGLEGPWTSAGQALPGDFARIPDDDPAAFVKASVPGTVEARDAVLLASVPATTPVAVSTPPTVEVNYSGEPKFNPYRTPRFNMPSIPPIRSFSSTADTTAVTKASGIAAAPPPARGPTARVSRPPSMPFPPPIPPTM
jgi:hypothetical protein